MRKIIYIAITFIICFFLELQTIWLGFVPVFLLVSQLKIDGNFLWEIPLALMIGDVLLLAFSEDITVLTYILAIAASAVISIFSSKKLILLFSIVIFSVLFKNTYTMAALWASVWYGLRAIFSYFTTKQSDLQEHKL